MIRFCLLLCCPALAHTGCVLNVHIGQGLTSQVSTPAFVTRHQLGMMQRLVRDAHLPDCLNEPCVCGTGCYVQWRKLFRISVCK